ncbi:MAG: DNA methyltransferase, partial [Candidatus Paceibacterota bacterium]
MSEARKILEDIINDFSANKFGRFFREKSRQFLILNEDYSRQNNNDFENGLKVGEINFSDSNKLIICAFQAKRQLIERAGRKAQYEKAKEILKSSENRKFSGGIFIFYDKSGSFRFSLVYPETIGTRRQWSNFRRFTYFASSDPQIKNRTFLKQIGDGDISDLEKVKDAFSIAAVTDLFYDEFFKIYDKLVLATRKANSIDNEEKTHDFILLFVIRTIFIGFIQKKKWIGDDEKFIQNFLKEYNRKFSGKNEFYSRWLSPLFFQALNSPPGQKVEYGNNEFSKETDIKLQMAPYLNGGLFKHKTGYDNNSWIIPDKEIEEFFDFLFAHSFTIEENSLDDEDLQLNPEFLGIIFERLVNKADGAVYTPKTEVDLMCRLSLIKWLQKNTENQIKVDNLYELFFKESEKEDEQKEGSFSKKEAEEILYKLENLSICDPAVGSGAFLVGMMHVLDDVEQSLKKRFGLNGKDLFDRKRQIIKASLYGVEVKEWAVWICQLRLWLSLFVDAPDDLKSSFDPILPSLDFKVRQGDSLVQRVGSKSFPVSGHNLAFSKSTKDKITKLKNIKLQYFDNKTGLKEWELRQKELAIYDEILGDEIAEKDEKLRNLKNTRPGKTMNLFNERVEPEQALLEFDKDTIQKIEKDISELREQKQALRGNGKPLVWSIEFAEVFAEKNGFDIIIGNPPYVRQEAIADPIGKVKDKKEYKNYLQEMVKSDFPNDFLPVAKINAQSDLYTYFYIRGLRLLNPNGIHTFICSNSWLDVGYGVWLQEFLLKRCAIEFIIDNHSKRSFKAADVNTIISIIHAPQKKVNENHLVKFVAFKKSFEEAIFTENMLAIDNAKQIESNNVFRVYPIATANLKEFGIGYQGESQKKMKLGQYIGDKWGSKYLRAPDIFFTILEKGKGKFVKLGNIADVRFGIKTGVNEFFYLSNEQLKRWNIEPEFLKPVIKSPRECKSILVNTKSLKYKIFICNKSREELKGTYTLKYIEWGEKQRTKEGIYWKDVPSVSGRKYWYSLGERKPARINFNYLIDEIGNSYIDEIFVSDNFHEIHTDKIIEWFLNSSIFYLFQLNTGRISFGGGLLKIQTYELNSLPVMETKACNIGYFNDDKKSIFKECGIDPKSNIPIEEQEPN